MKTQRGSIGTGAIIAIASLAVVVLMIVTVIGSYISYANYGNRTEVALEATRENNKNILAQYGQKVQEAAQVPTMAREDLQKIVEAAIGGRYGPDGSKATWQMIREQNPSIDPQLYRKIQQLIEGGRNEFQNGQKMQIDQLRSYKTALGNVWSGFWLGMAGYPKTDLKRFNIISTDRADDAYQRGKEEGPLKLR